VDAAPKAASASPAASGSGAGSPASTIDPAAREALDAMDPQDRTAPAVPDVAAPWSAALDAQTEAEAARKREARRKVEELLGGAFDYEEIRSVARAATAEPGVSRGRYHARLGGAHDAPSRSPGRHRAPARRERRREKR
jgi:hypothetical protein